ncbi:MAG: peptide chain release factor N(5)-glutamine methyltransferase [Flavobacteriales bacterium]|nr:peptide chain release factor N(5)-glutamine methyltransferase [Flavobacteriales bacterium]
MYRNLKSLRAFFRQQLESYYSEREAENILYVILEDIFGISRHDLLMAPDAIRIPEISEFDAILQRLIQHEPIQYITGIAPFRNYKFRVDPSVLIPRPETEELVQWILEMENFKELNIMDIGTGSGCIAWSLYFESEDWRILGTDISEAAIELARKNGPSTEHADTRIKFQVHDILTGESHLPPYPYDVIVSNPPYIPKSEESTMELRVTLKEPHSALFTPDDDALLFYRHIASLGSSILRPGGRLYFEIHESRGPEIQFLLESLGYHEVEIRRDLQGKDRMIRAVNS